MNAAIRHEQSSTSVFVCVGWYSALLQLCHSLTSHTERPGKALGPAACRDPCHEGAVAADPPSCVSNRDTYLRHPYAI